MNDILSHHMVISEHNLLLFLLQFALLLGLCRLVGFFFAKMKQSSVTGELLVGILLGPAIFGKLAPGLQNTIFPNDLAQRSMLETVAWFGNLFLLMETGLEINFSRVWKQGMEAVKITVADLLIPVLLCFLPIYLLPDRYLVDPSQRFLFALFISVIMTISALPIAIRGLRDLNILKTDVGLLIISALTMNDIVGWVVFTIIMGIFAHGSMDLGFVGQLVGLTLLFTVLSLTLGRRLLDRAVTLIHDRAEDNQGLKVTLIVLVGALFGSLTLGIGIHALFGFFIAGIVLGEARHIHEKDRFVVNRLVYSIFVPVFFANIGLRLDFVANFDWFLVLLLSALGIAGRFLGAYAGAAWARQPRENFQTIAISHTPGGEMHIVVGMLAYTTGLINEVVLVAIIVASLVSTIVFGFWLSFIVNRLRKTSYDIVLEENDVFIDRDNSDPQAMLAWLSGIAARKTGIDQQTILQELTDREEQLSTAVGRSLAMPHARLEGIEKSQVFIVQNQHGIEWDSPDGLPVHLFILILTPKARQNAQIQILRSLSLALQDRKLTAQLLDSNDPKFLWNTIRSELTTCSRCRLA